MKNKTAKIVTAIAVLGAGYVGASWWLGKQVEARYQVLIDRVATRIGTEHVAERRYERGLFGASSTVVLQVRLPEEAVDEAANAQEAEEPRPERYLRVTLQDDIRHGPLPGWHVGAAHSRMRVAQVEGLDEATRQAFAKASWPEFDTLVAFDGAYSGQMRLPAGEATDPTAPGTRATWQPLTYDYRVSANGAQVDGTMRWPRVSVRMGDAESPDDASAVEVHVDALQARFDYLLADDQSLLAPGQGSGTIGAIEFLRRAQGQATFQPLASFKDIRFDSQTTREAGLLNATHRATGQGRLDELELKEVRYESEMRRIDERALATAQKLLMRLTAGPSDVEAVPAQEQDAMVRRLLDARPEYRDSFSATLADGQLARFAYGVSMPDTPSGQPQALAGLPWQAELMQRLRFDADLRVPKVMLAALGRLSTSHDVGQGVLAMVADAAARRGWLREESGAYVATADYQAGALRLNGQPFMGGLGAR